MSAIQRPAWITSQTCAPLGLTGGAQRVAAYMPAAAREQVVRPFALEPGPGRAHPLVDDAVWPALQAHGRTSDIAALLDVTQFDDTHARREAHRELTALAYMSEHIEFDPEESGVGAAGRWCAGWRVGTRLPMS